MARPFLVILALLTTAGPILAQGSSLMKKDEFEAFVSKLRQDSQGWARMLSSIDVASISETRAGRRDGKRAHGLPRSPTRCALAGGNPGA